MYKLISWAVAALIFVSACAREPDDRQVLVLAASSMQESLDAAAEAWAAEGNPRPVISFAATSSLARQIESGAEADIFISADQDWMDAIEQGGWIRSGSRRDLVTNALVMVAPIDGPRSLALDTAAIDRVLGDGRIAMAEPESVPAGRYATAALENLGLWAALEDRTARAENVRAALALVERGEAPLGIVYATDAQASERVRAIATFPPASHPAIVYPVALLKDAGPDAEAFLGFLESPEGRAIFSAYGFSVPAS